MRPPMKAVLLTAAALALIAAAPASSAATELPPAHPVQDIDPRKALDVTPPAGAQRYETPAAVTARSMDRGTYSVAVVHRISFPVGAAPIASSYGPRTCPEGPCTSFHEGLDFGADEGSAVKAVAAGTVVFAGVDGNYGNKVVLDHTVNGEVFTTVYAHLQTGSTAVTVGQPVERGQILAQVGNTGRSYGAHLHFEVRIDGSAVDPGVWFAEHNAEPFPG